jgi:hypothetical protein
LSEARAAFRASGKTVKDDGDWVKFGFGEEKTGSLRAARRG